jgi:hypothetical protein
MNVEDVIPLMDPDAAPATAVVTVGAPPVPEQPTPFGVAFALLPGGEISMRLPAPPAEVTAAALEEIATALAEDKAVSEAGRDWAALQKQAAEARDRVAELTGEINRLEGGRKYLKERGRGEGLAERLADHAAKLSERRVLLAAAQDLAAVLEKRLTESHATFDVAVKRVSLARVRTLTAERNQALASLPALPGVREVLERVAQLGVLLSRVSGQAHHALVEQRFAREDFEERPVEQGDFATDAETFMSRYGPNCR